MRLGEHLVALAGDGTPDPTIVGNKAASLARMAGLGLAVPPAFRTTSPKDIHGVIAATAILTELGAPPSTQPWSVARSASRSSSGAERGTLGRFADGEVALDGGRGLVFEGLLPVQHSTDMPIVATLRAWAAALSVAP